MRFHMTDRDSSPPSSGESPQAEGGCCGSQCSAQRPTRTNLSVCHLQVHIAPGSWASQLTPQLEMQICPGKYSSWVNWVSFQKPLSSRRRPWRVMWVALHKTQRYELWEIVRAVCSAFLCLRAPQPPKQSAGLLRAAEKKAGAEASYSTANTRGIELDWNTWGKLFSYDHY